MQLVEPLNYADYDLTLSDPYFVPTFGHDLDELDSIDIDLAAIEDVATGVDIAGITASLDGPLAGIDNFLSGAPGDDGTAAINNLVGAAGAIDAGVTTSNTALQAATNKGISIAVPITPLHGITVSPPSAPSVPAPVLPAPGAPGPVGPPAVGVHLQFTNVTRPGSPGRVKVGESFTVAITGPPGVSIYAVATHNGVNNGQAGFGVIPPSGTLMIGGSFGVADKGPWIENWYAQGNYIGQVAFTVE